ncbi:MULTISPECIES: hypothetical protein [Sphingomonas]|uniref:hypothetical protein n=1 Tax=Sphingomonas TaxID=13687 RepID=UPI000F7E3483|nr:hypothetical protein [Sphingomonas sp. ABOLF]
MAEDEKSVSRKIYFFRIEHFQDLKQKIAGAIQRIENLPFNDNGRYLLDPKSGARLCAFPDTLDYPIRLRFGRTRRDDLPEVERNGRLESLELAEDAGLIDLGHLIIFEDGHVAAEWNPDGPKLQRLSSYLFERGGLADSIKFRNLFERDIVEVVALLNNVRVLDISIPADAVQLAREADKGLGDAIVAAEKLGGTQKVGLSLASQGGSTKLRELALKLAKFIQMHPTERKRFNTLRATGYNETGGGSRYIDILEDKLVSVEVFPKRSARSRSINSDEAYRLIHRSYIEMKPKLASAASGTDL